MRGNCEVDDGKKFGFAHFIYGHEGGIKTVGAVFKHFFYRLYSTSSQHFCCFVYLRVNILPLYYNQRVLYLQLYFKSVYLLFPSFFV
jgi:hypothetical protein